MRSQIGSLWGVGWAAAISLFLGVTNAEGADPPARPNVVLILADDLGWSDLGCYGADLHETPHLDRLARQGLRFTQSYTMSVCSPTRASLMTGKHAARLHMTIWREKAVELQRQTAPPSQRLLQPAPATNLPMGETTLAELFRNQGYLTFHVGKWHLADASGYPEVHGFDVNIGGTHWGAPSTYFHPFKGARQFGGEYRYVPGLGVGKSGQELTERLTDEALRLIDEAGERPFFLNLWHHAPHTPIEARPERVEHFRGKIRSGMKHQNAAYAAMVATLDHEVGRVLDHLDARGLARNTIVIFMSDNGGYLGAFDRQVVTNNAPLRSGKGSLYEGGIRVPTIVRWTGVTPAGAVCDRPIHCTDLWPTLAEIVRPSRDEGESDGVSLLPLWKKPESRLARENLFFHYPHDYATTTPVSAIRSGDWKLLEYYDDGRTELYNLASDPGESRNVASDQPAVARRLRTTLHDWRREVDAQVPTINPAYQTPSPTGK
ncbi:MAG: sulfatase [Isosphaeraceae bacterium]